ncbi:MAG: lipase secretion chaperone [Lysobacteraceae bacterium]
MSPRRAGLGLVALLGVAALGWWRWPAPAAGHGPQPAPPTLAADATQGPGAGLHRDGGLRGAAWDGALQVDAAGRVVPDLGLRRLFDHALAEVGERSDAALRARLAEHLARHGPRVAAEAVGLFDRYVAYLRALDNAALSPLDDAEARHARAVALRRAWLGERMAEGFFAAEEARAAHGLARRALVADERLDAAERQRRLEALDATLPPELAAARREAGLAARAESLDAALAARPAVERHHERAQRFGQAAAQRLALLDAQRADWDARVAAYVRERQRLGLDPAQAAGPQRAAFEQLRARHFDTPSQRRVASLEAIGALPAPGG